MFLGEHICISFQPRTILLFGRIWMGTFLFIETAAMQINIVTQEK